MCCCVGGSVTCDTTAAVKKSGLASWKCNTGAGAANAYLERDAILANAGRRISFYLCLTNIPSAGTSIVQLLSGTTDRIGLIINSSGVLGCLTGSGSTLAVNTLYRITFAYTITSQTVNEFRVYLNGNLDSSATNVDLGSVYTLDNVRVGWVYGLGVGTNKVLNFQDRKSVV